MGLANRYGLGVYDTAINLNTNIYTTDLPFTKIPAVARISVCYSTAAVLNVILKNGAATLTMKLNGGAALLADVLYVFDMVVGKNDSLNFQFDTSGTIRFFALDVIADWGP